MQQEPQPAEPTERPATPIEFNIYLMGNEFFDTCPWCKAAWNAEGGRKSRTHDPACPFWVWVVSAN